MSCSTHNDKKAKARKLSPYNLHFEIGELCTRWTALTPEEDPTGWEIGIIVHVTNTSCHPVHREYFVWWPSNPRPTKFGYKASQIDLRRHPAFSKKTQADVCNSPASGVK